MYKQPPSRLVKSLKKKIGKLHCQYVFAPADKAANNVIIIWKRHYEGLKGELNSTSTYVPAQLTKDQLLVHNINTLTKINVKIDECELPTIYWLPKLHKRPYKSLLYHDFQVTALLKFVLSILHLLLQLSKIMLCSHSTKNWIFPKLLVADTLYHSPIWEKHNMYPNVFILKFGRDTLMITFRLV